MRSAALALAALAALLPTRGAANVVVLAQPGVAQYAEVVAGIREVRAVPAVDVADPAAVAGAFARPPDVVIAVGARAVEVARERAGGAVVVATAVLAPEPGGTVAAVPLETRAADALSALAAVAPRVRRVVALHAPGARAAVADAREAASAARLDVTFVALADLGDFQAAFRRALDGADAVWLLADPRVARPDLVKFMVTTCLERRVPLVGFLDGMTRIGALLSVSPDFRAIGREAARLAGELDARPDVRHRAPFRFAPGKLSVNERVREMLGLDGRPPPSAEIYR